MTLQHSKGFLVMQAASGDNVIVPFQLPELAIAVVRSVHWNFPLTADSNDGVLAACLSHNLDLVLSAGFFQEKSVWADFSIKSSIVTTGGQYGVGNFQQDYPGPGFWIGGDQLLSVSNLIGATVHIYVDVWWEMRKVSRAVKAEIVMRTAPTIERENR